MNGDRKRVGTITDAVERYGLVDGAEAWGFICSGAMFRTSDGRLVRLEADPDKREGTLWIVEEVEVA